jgi:hypothetical protein
MEVHPEGVWMTTEAYPEGAIEEFSLPKRRLTNVIVKVDVSIATSAVPFLANADSFKRAPYPALKSTLQHQPYIKTLQAHPENMISVHLNQQSHSERQFQR